MLFCQQHFKVTTGLKAGRVNQIDFEKFSVHKTRSSRPRASVPTESERASVLLPTLLHQIDSIKNEAYRITERQC